MTPANFIPDTNPFRLAGPPVWFLRQLHEFDPSLRIVPSRQGFYYRLAQYRPLQLSEKIVHDVMKEQADTRMLASYGLVPVTTILATANWGSPLFFLELQKRAPWRMGGAQKFTEMVEGQDRKERLDHAIQQDAMLTDRATDAWKYYQQKAGLRSQLYSPKTPDRRPVSRGLLKTGRKTAYTPEVQTAWGNVLRKGR